MDPYTATIVARPEMLDAMARCDEFDVEPVTSRAGAAVVRDAEIYLQFFAELEPRPERAETKPESDTCCVRCGRSTPWKMYECPGCRGLR